MTAKDRDRAVQVALERARCGIVGLDDANTLRRAEMTLHRWGEAVCNGWIERDEDDGKVYRVVRDRYAVARYTTADRERGALARVAAVCERLGLHWYYQTDPRGCALYVSKEPLTDSDYTRGVAICD